jgi:hypothetical protein
MDEASDQEQGGGLFDTLIGKGKEYLSDPQNQEQLMGQARERFGNVPSMDQVAGLMGQTGQGTGRSDDLTSAPDVASQSFEDTGQGYGDPGDGGYRESYAGEEASSQEP